MFGVEPESPPIDRGSAIKIAKRAIKLRETKERMGHLNVVGPELLLFQRQCLFICIFSLAVVSVSIMKHTQSLERWGKFHVFAAKPFCLVLKQPYEQFLRFAEVAFGSVNIDKVDQRIADTRIRSELLLFQRQCLFICIFSLAVVSVSIMKHTQSLERWGKFHVFAAKPFCLVLKQPYEQFLRFAEVAFGSVNIDKVDQRIADTRIVARQKSFSYFQSSLRRSQRLAVAFFTD